MKNSFVNIRRYLGVLADYSYQYQHSPLSSSLGGSGPLLKRMQSGIAAVWEGRLGGGGFRSGSPVLHERVGFGSADMELAGGGLPGDGTGGSVARESSGGRAHAQTLYIANPMMVASRSVARPVRAASRVSSDGAAAASHAASSVRIAFWVGGATTPTTTGLKETETWFEATDSLSNKIYW